MMSPAQNEIAHALRNKITIALAHVQNPDCRKALEEASILIDQLYTAPVSKEGNKVVVELHGRRVVIISDHPRPGIQPIATVVRLEKCAWDECGGVFAVDGMSAERRRFHSRRCLEAWHNHQQKLQTLKV